MRISKVEEKIICDRCECELRGWEDSIASGELNIMHSSVIGDIFSEGAGKQGVGNQREYFEQHKAIKFGQHPHQSIILKYGGEADYHLCWNCNREFLKILGGFFKQAPKSI